MKRIVREAQIWDLHIHTTLGTPTKKNYNEDVPKVFVDKVIEIYEHSKNKMGMISFTDHNQINVPVYECFKEKSNISLLPGIELDIFIKEADINSKHIIFYFEEKELDHLNELNNIIQDYLYDNKKILFDQFVLHLISKEKKFVISPHAFKQGKRAIDYEWTEDFSAKKGVKKFVGSFFVFWEASGQSEICKAMDFLSDYYLNNDHKVIAFSDSSTYESINKYVENPNQYFLCLNTFQGLLLAGSDNDRIIYEKDDRPGINPSEKIKKLIVKNNIDNKENPKIEIEFSDRLNVIIGGRGQGKSALLDTLAYGIDDKLVKSKRTSFVKKFEPEVINFRDNKLTMGTKVIYFSQSHINDLFDGKSQDNLITFFKEEFGWFSNFEINVADVITEYERVSLRYFDSGIDCNIVDDLANLIIIEKVNKQIKVRSGKAKKLDFHVKGNSYEQVVKSVLSLPDEIWDDELECFFDLFIKGLVLNIAKFNRNQLYDKKYAQLIKKKIDAINKQKSTNEKKKVVSSLNLRNKLQYIYKQELKRICIINNMYSIDKSKTKLETVHSEYNGEGENKFFFVVAINKEHPVEYARRLIIEGINAAKLKSPELKSNKQLFILFAINDSFSSLLKEAYTLESITNLMQLFSSLKHSRAERIIYKCNDNYYNLHDVSPGTQTNAIMEYLLHSESTIPLLIDQPEDNIDNEARFEKLTKWIRKQKYNRQIVLVTHDANIVINGDAECVIVASYDGNVFSYKYGALEYEDILDSSAIILDGGKYAVQRRITKYGE